MPEAIGASDHRVLSSTRCPGYRRPRRPPDRTRRRLLSSTTLLVLALLLVLSVCVSAQSSTTSASIAILAVSATSTALTSTQSSTSPSLADPTPTISISTLPTLLNLPSLNSSVPAIRVSLPSTSPLYITLNICSFASDTSLVPTVLVSTASPPTFALGTRSNPDRLSGGVGTANRRNRGGTVWQLEWDAGFANWTWSGGEVGAGMLVGLGVGTEGTVNGSAMGQASAVVQMGVSNTGTRTMWEVSLILLAPLHYLSPEAPLLGDTTSTSALLFSPLLLASPHDQPAYPNYTLPSPVLSLPTYPDIATNLTSLSPHFSLIVVPTASSPTNDRLNNSMCAVRSANISTGGIADPSHMLVNASTSWMAVGGEEGFRTMWVVGDLVAGTNYTAWIVDDNGGMSGPIWLATKESECCGMLPTQRSTDYVCLKETFPCPLVLPRLRRPARSQYDRCARSHPISTRRHHHPPHLVAPGIVHLPPLPSMRAGSLRARLVLRGLLRLVSRLALPRRHTAVCLFLLFLLHQ